ncbi:hepcidin-like [Hippocampus comes]|uniref:hepcidin-like n=1 Tax=Hippocampus comes TaxID=109280 RepID=UPI00094E7441|nr:PREDICTED: hepcidin-like [Hippocampus comes]
MMKPFNLSVAVIIMLAFLFIQEGSTISLDNREPDQHMMETRDDAAAEIPVDLWKVADNKRQKRHNGACKVCCNCCGQINFCGLCCEW